MAQEQNELGKYVTDGKHTYPYNAFLDELINNGTLKYCDKPVREAVLLTRKSVPRETPLTLTLQEREVMAGKLGITVGDLGNMSPQEFAAAKAELEQTETVNKGFLAEA
jgi:hypothetical protein